jgi:hypothetical protein
MYEIVVLVCTLDLVFTSMCYFMTLVSIQSLFIFSLLVVYICVVVRISSAYMNSLSSELSSGFLS